MHSLSRQCHDRPGLRRADRLGRPWSTVHIVFLSSITSRSYTNQPYYVTRTMVTSVSSIASRSYTNEPHYPNPS